MNDDAIVALKELGKFIGKRLFIVFIIVYFIISVIWDVAKHY